MPQTSATPPVDTILPSDGFSGTLIGRAWIPVSSDNTIAGPAPVWLTSDGVFDLSAIAPTVSELINRGFDTSQLNIKTLPYVGSYHTIMTNTLGGTNTTDDPATTAHFLSPVDIQAIKACGVTFICSMLERIIEERADGDANKADAVRQQLAEKVDVDLASIVPGSEQAEALKQVLQEQGLWSQYLEVGIGPYAEVFTKAQPLSSVGVGAEVGLHPISSWNNPEPEVVLIVNRQAEVIGATLGNDVNLRDVEGRSALLLGKAKDNNASAAIGPFIRLFDDSFNIDDVRQMEVNLTITGDDGFELSEVSPMTMISRDVLDLVAQTINDNHQYPDGLALYTGTLFAPTQNRDDSGSGFTHKLGDRVSIRSDKLGTLTNTVTLSNKAPPWEFGIAELMRNLAARKLL